MADDKRFLNRDSQVEVLEREQEANAVLFDMVDMQIERAKPATRESLAPRPDFKNNYSSHKLNKVYNQIDLDTFTEEHTFVAKRQSPPKETSGAVVPTKQGKSYSFDMVLDAQEEISPELEIKTYSAPKPKKTFSFGKRSKVFVAACACVAVLFGGLLIYNSVTIGQYSGRLESQQSAIDTQLDKLNGVDGIIQDYHSKTGDAAVDQAAQDLGLTPNQNTNNTKINIKPQREEVKYNVITNLFDRLCNFIASIFGR